MKSCKKHIQHICDYIDGEIDESLCFELEQHLKECKDCRIMVDTLRQTVILCREGRKKPLPRELEERLSDAIRQRWEKKFKKKR
nr:zf-HC2 domain-containing protein [candidate division Zixibacteria bacterium]